MATATPAQVIEWQDVQGLVLRGYAKHQYSTYVFLQVENGPQARAWLASICDRITTSDRTKATPQDYNLNVAFTTSGLVKLGMPEGYLDTFPTAFFEGMASSTRAKIL